jgi:hypothetical protein
VAVDGEGRVMAHFALPSPWNAPESDRHCGTCGHTTRHFGRRLTLVEDADSDRQGGEVAWFCTECGHKHAQPEPAAGPPADDDLSQMFDRH